MLFGIAAALHGFKEKMLFKEHYEKYKKMKRVFQEANRHFDISEDKVRTRKIIFEIGKEAIKEAGDWLLLNRSKPIEIPKG